MYVFNVALAIICTECTKKSRYTLKHYSIYNYWSKNMPKQEKQNLSENMITVKSLFA